MQENHGQADDEDRLDVDGAVVFVQQAVQLVEQVPHDEVAEDERRSGAGQHLTIPDTTVINPTLGLSHRHYRNIYLS